MDYTSSLLTRTEFLDTVLIGLLGALVLKAGSYVYKIIVNKIYKDSHFSISGFWVANFSSYIAGKENIELVRIRQNKESIRFYLEQYSNILQATKRFKGQGILRGTEMSSIYYPIDRNKIQNGVFILRLLDSCEDEPHLTGIFAEFHYDNENEKASIQKADYSLQPMKMPHLNRLLFLFRKVYFKSYSDVDAFLKKHNKNAPAEPGHSIS